MTGEITVLDGSLLDDQIADQRELIVSVSDKKLSSTATITIDINNVNEVPVAEHDSYFVDEDMMLSVGFADGVLANDSDPNGDALMASLISGPENGFVVLNSDGSFSYTPKADFNGSDSFIYEASDGNGGTNTATVFIEVSPINDDPVAIDDFAETNEDTPINLYVLANDTDVDLDALTIESVDGTTLLGIIAIDSEGGFLTFDPNGEFENLTAGSAINGTIDYTVSDGNGGSDTATVTVIVTGVNDVPDAIDDTAETNEDTPIDIPVLDNDEDIDLGDALTIAFADGLSAYGAIITVGSGGGFLTYDPSGSDLLNQLNDGQFIDDTFDYTVSDEGGKSDIATVTVRVYGVNDVPEIDML